jgi:hypothetical protein
VAYFGAGRQAASTNPQPIDIQSAFNWHPSGKWLGFVLENRIALCDAQSGKILF